MVKKTSQKLASLFDIRLNNDHDVLVLKGNANDAASALLSGKIALSVNEPFSIRKLSLRLYATIRLNYSESISTIKGPAQKPVRFERKLYEHVWDPQDINRYLNNLYENTAQSTPGPGTLSRNQSLSSLKNFGSSLRTKSATNLLHLSLTHSSTNLAEKHHTLVLGNYEIPFSAVLPGSMPESVEGLPGGLVIYMLEASIDRGKFHNSLLAKRHVRVIRTLTTDAVELSETVAVDNTWPKKVEYSLNVPSKAIAIGSGTPISFMLVPLLKGLRLGDIKITLVEHYSYVGFLPPPFSGERVITEKTIKRPAEDDPNFQMDKWEVDTFIKVPPSLSKCTQDCDISTHLKVRHKIKFVIGLVNPDGHVSELRASLPVQLFISPFVMIRARPEEDHSGPNSTHALLVDLASRADEELLFSTDPHSASHTSLNQLSETSDGLRLNNSTSSFTGLVAPPLYEKHVYDRLWSDISPVESPMSSGTATPRTVHRPTDVQSHFSMSPIDTVQLNENLRQLSLQRQLQELGETPLTSSLPRDRAVFNLDGESHDVANGDYFTRGRPIVGHQQSHDGLTFSLTSGAMMSPPVHLLRVGSETNILSSAELSRVPSYQQAMRSEVADEMSPAYEPPLPGSRVNIDDHIERPSPSTSFGHSRNKSFLSRGSSSANLRNYTDSRTSSNSSSPSNSRNVSYTNLMSLSRSGSRSDHLSPSPGMSLSTSPVNVSLKNHDSPYLATVRQPSSSAADRSAIHGSVPIKSSSSLSLHNLHFLNKKKEKK